ncbi:MAG TPA: 2-amino-4-hydroxy-6-hydroxymethyldihydropteridine diphosphokinase [Chitinophagales bacterium]|mgnify:FL=1|nr:2-amino-4-hydroxy-6-hydroxymethyldihydropteridine diphosphokinase [Chitinophagales bacterium]MBP6153344.1 2-amino-4-hydroxy-6-hydroxymethyldihydropteridine diphosphokinase [Chitinophagales bacterium]HQV77421.1 2-amino-4-hydroxy-6-hydroxymethyldihydropteridine diphosphokinase [Chitinophagales bacterium]HQW78483.1 2-amino-4-hydroxy-6-hydroxymethyldihydropteridine diphosphokinase [Chitinophagales bacterium]HRB67690.1 2-amino-4-hydroxy-6-hydroxymethyldihydropteridine diphosphokinase [Chitinophag
MNTIYLLLGSNKNHRIQYLLAAKHYLQLEVGEILQVSSIYETEPWGNLNQPKYLNQVLELSTSKTPFQLLHILQKIEKNLGRTNKQQNAARTIDIDILFYEGYILHAKNLQIPHPRLHLRKFTLQPLMEVNKSYIHPIFKKTIEELIKICADDLKVGIFTPK